MDQLRTYPHSKTKATQSERTNMSYTMNSGKVPCLVCQSFQHFPLYFWEKVPLSVVGLQSSKQDAEAQANLTMDIRRCAQCGHIFNQEFDPLQVGYHKSSNLVYNKGHSWSLYQEKLAQEWIQKFQIEKKCIVEIGCGEGLFLAQFLPFSNHCIGYEPGHDATQTYPAGLKIIQDYFDINKYHFEKIDVILCRHVIEHLAEPLNFLREIALFCQLNNFFPLFCAEVPMIDKAIKQVRINDFLYEHVSNFTFNSFKTLFELAGFEILEHQARYENEVVTIVASPKKNTLISQIQKESAEFNQHVYQQQQQILATLSEWQTQNKTYAFWAATGKGAAFLNMFNLTSTAMPLIIDSDPRKFDKYVPGTGQKILSPKYLTQNPVDFILIGSNWHARDIEHEIRQIYQLSSTLFVYLNGEIVELTKSLEL